jgi:hypothetical protein
MSVTLARVATMHTELLKEMTLEEVLAVHPLLDAQRLSYRRAIKVKPIKVKPVSSILNDDSVMSKMVLATLEGHQTVKANAFVCWGVDNDLWQQNADKLHMNYNLVSVDPDGWIHCQPKDDAPRNAAQITEAVARDLGFEFGPAHGFSILNPTYGDERVLDGRQVYLHYGVLNDYVLQMPKDAIDTYRVARKFFDNTYELEGK